MDGVHDLGGMHNFGPVQVEADEPVFHADWERRALAIVLAAGTHGRWSIDRSRFIRESLPPATYLNSSYYEIWVRALEPLLRESGLLAADDQDGEPEPPLAKDWVTTRAGLESGSPYDRAVDSPAAFAAGERVRTLVMHPPGHTRLPRYARGKIGQVVAVRGAHVFPDRNALPMPLADGCAEWLYTVRFSGTELFGEQGDPTASVTIDAFEPYLRASS